MKTAKIQVVGFDGSLLSEVALHQALHSAGDIELPTIHVVLVTQEDHGRLRLPGGGTACRWKALLGLKLTVGALVKEWNIDQGLTRLVCHVISGEETAKLLEIADYYEAQRILIGSHSCSRHRSGRIGHTASSIASEARCEVHIATPMTQAEPRPPAQDPLKVFLLLGDGFTASGESRGPRVASC